MKEQTNPKGIELQIGLPGNDYHKLSLEDFLKVAEDFKILKKLKKYCGKRIEIDFIEKYVRSLNQRFYRCKLKHPVKTIQGHKTSYIHITGKELDSKLYEDPNYGGINASKEIDDIDILIKD